jgi:hypothetical protein
VWRALAISTFVLPLVGALLPFEAQAQVQRNFPAKALRGEVTFGEPPQAQLNRQATQLAPGARIRDTNNMMVVSGSLKGQRVVVNYTLDSLGQLHEVWILREEETRKLPWPRTPAEAQSWVFDPVAQTWTKP